MSMCGWIEADVCMCKELTALSRAPGTFARVCVCPCICYIPSTKIFYLRLSAANLAGPHDVKGLFEGKDLTERLKLELGLGQGQKVRGWVKHYL